MKRLWLQKSLDLNYIKVHVVGEGEGGGGKVNVNGLCQLITNSCLIVAARTGQPLIFVLKASDNSNCRGSLFRCFS